MAHKDRYESFLTKKAIEKKERAKTRSGYYCSNANNNFQKSGDQYDGVVIETSYHDVSILYNGDVVTVGLSKGVKDIPNKLLYPGDRVILGKEDGKLVVENALNRTTCLSRIRKDSTRLNDIGNIQIVAANVDVAAIVVSAKTPPLHPRFIDRYLIILQKNDIESMIVLNKCDLKTNDDEKVLNIYRELGIKVIETSAINGVGIDELKNAIKGKQAILVGNSGVGKSSLINAVMEFEDIRVSHVSHKSGRGRHTTTSSKYYVWDEGSSIIDSPGIRSIDVSGLEPLEVQNYFHEIKRYSALCKFEKNCLHFKDDIKVCGVKQAVLDSLIDERRYESYCRIIADLTMEQINNNSKQVKKTRIVLKFCVDKRPPLN